jgi:hypothetical protein
MSATDHHVGLRFPARWVAQAQERRIGGWGSKEVSDYSACPTLSADFRCYPNAGRRKSLTSPSSKISCLKNAKARVQLAILLLETPPKRDHPVGPTMHPLLAQASGKQRRREGLKRCKSAGCVQVITFELKLQC